MRIVRNLPDDGARVPSMAVAAYASSIEREKALCVGYDAQVAKPVERERLLTAIVRVLNDCTAERVP